MGDLIRAMDWSKTALGPMEDWPQSLRTSISLCLSSTFPILIAWGPHDIQIYNDSYRPICGPKHPEALGQDFKICWATALPVVGAAFEKAHRGEGAYIKDQQMFLDRHGYLEEAFMTFSFGGIRDESGQVGGIFHPITETTEATLSARRTQAVRDLSARISHARSMDELVKMAAEEQKAFELDLPFLLFYGLDALETKAQLAGSAGLEDQNPLRIQSVDLSSQALAHSMEQWPFAEAIESGAAVRVDSLSRRFGKFRCGPFESSPEEALILPIRPAGASRATGFLVAGVSAARALDQEYLNFFAAIADAITAAASTIRAYEDEKERAEALAKIDRAKTVFFSNVSHEFRTPLTLILGPLEDFISQRSAQLSRVDNQTLELIQRNASRLLKLVNSLLDFSRIEAGRMEASFAPTEIGKFTADLASLFQSAMEKAGLIFRIEISDHIPPVYLDTAMWEKIVLNLISNALKFTLKGEICVRLSAQDTGVQLEVTDSGIGISEENLPKVFERFHRIEEGNGRSIEGTGIGLALVQELVRLHGGTIKAVSRLGAGSRFLVEIPFGVGHLPATQIQDQVSRSPSSEMVAKNAQVFIAEAEKWVSNSELDPQVKSNAVAPIIASKPGTKPVILLADDNADMREYVCGILDSQFDVQTATDGLDALEKIQSLKPALLISDVMMPKLDGFALLNRLRSSPETAGLRIILLSARAGEESRIEGLEAGADDYLVKPFSARELRARVESTHSIEKIRSMAVQTLRRSEEQFRSMFSSTSVLISLLDQNGKFIKPNDSFAAALGQTVDTLRDRDFAEFVLNDDVDLLKGKLAELKENKKESSTFEMRYRKSNGENFWVQTTLSTFIESESGERQLIAISQEIASQKESEERARISEESAHRANQSKSAFLANMSHEIRTPLGIIKGFSELLLSDKSLEEKDKAEFVTTIQRNAENLTAIINDILDLSKIEAGKIEIERADFELAQLLREVRVVAEFKAQERGISVQFEISKETPLLVYGDEMKIRQILLNLLSNAVKFTPAGSVKLSVKMAEQDRISFVVTDSGIGLTPDQQTRLFKPFSQADGSITRKFGGTGLGLALSKNLAEAMEGDLKLISSAESQGSSFEFSLPIHVQKTASVHAGAEREPRPSKMDRAPLAQRKILLVEDSVDNQALISRYLKSAGAEVRLASDGLQALEILASHSFDVVLMDIQMPVLDGHQTILRLRGSGYLGVVIALTAHALKEEKDRAMNAGFNDYVTKPIDKARLIEAIDDLCRVHESKLS